MERFSNAYERDMAFTPDSAPSIAAPTVPLEGRRIAAIVGTRDDKINGFFPAVVIKSNVGAAGRGSVKQHPGTLVVAAGVWVLVCGGIVDKPIADGARPDVRGR